MTARKFVAVEFVILAVAGRPRRSGGGRPVARGLAVGGTRLRLPGAEGVRDVPDSDGPAAAAFDLAGLAGGQHVEHFLQVADDLFLPGGRLADLVLLDLLAARCASAR